MHDEHEEITDTLELAHRINSSTDIVTAQEGTIDSQQQTIDQTIVQAKDEIIEAFEHLTPGLVPIIEKIDQSTGEIMVGITGIAQKIDNIDFTPVEEKLDEIEGELMQGVTGLNQAVEEIRELVSGVTGYAQEDTLVQGITSIRADVSELREEVGQGFSGVEEKIDQGFTGLGNELVQGLSGLSNEILQGNSGISQDISEVKDLVSGVTGYALDATVAKEETLIQGVSSIESKIDNIDFTPVENKLEQIEGELVQGVTAINVGVEEIKELVSGVTGYAQQDTLVQGLTGLTQKIDVLQGSDDEADLTQISDRVKSLILTSVTKTEAVSAKQEILGAIGNIPEPDLSSVAKQGENPDVTLTGVDSKLGNMVLLTDEEFIEAIADLNTQLI